MVEQTHGVLRAVLDGDEIQGEILTPAMSGVISVFYVSTLAPEPLGNVTLSADRRFQITAVSLEKKSWQAGQSPSIKKVYKVVEDSNFLVPYDKYLCVFYQI